ncbi:MAG: methionyl-tRNA formyltransferase [Bacteroidales bacterium]|nr:MAG: methionyl-tRNA formyltransferase [Bacteroidales bacterium]
MYKDVRIVYMGTPDFAVEPLKALVNAGCNVIGVVTVPDKPAGRGQKIQSSPVKQYAQGKGLRIMQPEKLKNPEFIDELASLKPDIAVVVAFRMLPESVWTIPRIGTFNLHASLLPQYRGAAPINWAIINGEERTGVTTFLIDHEIDTGKVIFSEEINVSENETAGELHDRLMVIGAELVLKTVKGLADNCIKPISQENLLKTDRIIKSAPKIFRDTCRIDWSKTAQEIHNLIRGLSPYPAAWTEITFDNGSSIQAKILRSSLIEKKHNLEFGSIKIDGKNVLQVACSDEFISIAEIQLAGKRPMKTSDMLNGLRDLIPLRMI